jgi:hypothetical protein
VWIWQSFLMTNTEKLLRKRELAVFLALGDGFSSVGEISDRAGYSPHSVRRSLAVLVNGQFARRRNYRSFELSEKGHAELNRMWITYVKNNLTDPEVSRIIASTISEVSKMFTSDSDQDHEVSKTITSSEQNDRFNGSSMHVNDHACMDDGNFFGNKLADSGDAKRDLLEEELYEIGFDQPGRWLQKEDVSWELTAQWLEYVNNNNGIRNKAGFIRRQVESGDRPNLRSVEQQQQVPKEYEDVFLR